jgi:SAM-dependent methyltransferase
MNNNNIELLNQAERYFAEKNNEKALEIYKVLIDDEPEISAVSCMRLGEIANRIQDPEQARKLYVRAFETLPTLAKHITTKDHPHHNYVYKNVQDDISVQNCPLCGGAGKPYWCYIMINNVDYDPKFYPIRTWLYCESCHHLFASSYPSFPEGKAEIDEGINHRIIYPQLFSMYSNLLNTFREITDGNHLLDVGIGGGELVAVAREMLFDVVGIDISYGNIKNANETFFMNNICADFLEFQSEHDFDIICMGDVLEHIPDPVQAVKKAVELLAPRGILWISTPNFDSAYSLYAGYDDPMKRVANHLNYFSYPSLNSLLEKEGLEVVKYSISAHYNGSMEIIAIKK